MREIIPHGYSVKATTEEGLGLAGEGIGAYAVVILENTRVVKML